MLDSPLLGRVRLGHAPLLDRQRSVVATRLTVTPERADAPPEAVALLGLLADVWPAEPGPRGPALMLNMASEAWLDAVLGALDDWRPWLEVPAFLAADAVRAQALAAYADGGGVLVLRGRPVQPLPGALQGRFQHVIVEQAGAARPGEPAPIGEFDGTLAALDAGFQRGAPLMLGWPLADPEPATARPMPSDVQVAIELMDRLRREEPLDKLEAVLSKDATLAFRLLRYLNSPAFGLSVEISSLRHALQMLGYQRLGRWLALLLASASKEPAMRPLMYAATRRGLLLEALSSDAEMRGELFICGIFSLLDRMLRQPFAELLKSVPVPQRVQQALQDGSGPFQPYLELVRAVEGGAALDLREAGERLMLGASEINRALLNALLVARQLD